MSIELKPETAAIRTKIVESGKIVFDTATGIATPADKVWLKAVTSDTLSEAQIKELNAADTAFKAAQLDVFQEAALPVLKKNPELASVQMTVPTIGKDSITFLIEREREFPGVGGAEPTKTFGFASVKHTVYSAKNAGELKKVKTGMAELYKAALSK